MTYPTITDNGRFLQVISIPNTESNYPKHLCRVHKTKSDVYIYYSDNNLQICYWNTEMANDYGYSINELNTYILSILNTISGDFNNNDFDFTDFLIN